MIAEAQDTLVLRDREMGKEIVHGPTTPTTPTKVMAKVKVKGLANTHH